MWVNGCVFGWVDGWVGLLLLTKRGTDRFDGNGGMDCDGKMDRGKKSLMKYSVVKQKRFF